MLNRRLGLPFNRKFATNHNELNSQIQLQELIQQRDQLKQQLEIFDAQINDFAFEQNCGSDNTLDVEEYDETLLGITKSFIESHEKAVGQLQWVDDLNEMFSGAGDSPGDVSGERFGTGALISDELFLTAGHCFDQSGGGWERPRRGGQIILPREIALLMKVNFNYQKIAGTGLIRTVESFPITALVEYRSSGLDFAIVRLGKNEDGDLPGEKFGKLKLAATDLLENNATLCIIQHPDGEPKRVGVGLMLDNEDNQISYKIDTAGASSGAPILSLTGEIVGIHTDGTCTPSGGGFNYGLSIGAVQSVSSTIDSLSESIARSGASPRKNTSKNKKFITMRQTKNTKRIIDNVQKKLKEISSQELDFRVVEEELALIANTIKSTSQLPELKTDDFEDPGKVISFDDMDNVTNPDSIRERIVDLSDLLPIYFLEEGVRIQNSVARVVLTKAHTVNGNTFRPGTGWATGFLVSPSLFLTNNHVIPNEAFAKKIRIQFNYQRNSDGIDKSTEDYYPTPEDFFYTNPSLDFTLIRLRSKSVINDPVFGSGIIAPGQKWGFIQLNPDPVYLEEQHLNIIQHPSGRRKQIALQNNQSTDLYQNFIRYTTDTEPGSSGSPVFDNIW